MNAISASRYVPVDTNAGITALFKLERALTIGETAQQIERGNRASQHLPHAVLWGGASTALGYNVLAHGAAAAFAAAAIPPLAVAAALGGTIAMALAQISMVVVPSFWDRKNNPSVPNQATLEGVAKVVSESAKKATGLERAWLAVRADAIIAGLDYGPTCKPEWRKPWFNRLKDLPAVTTIKQTAELWSRLTPAERDEARLMLQCYSGVEKDLTKLSPEGRALVATAIANAIQVSKDLA